MRKAVILFNLLIFSLFCYAQQNEFIVAENYFRNNEYEKAYLLNKIKELEELNISENDNSLDLSLALEVALYFRLTSKKANSIIEEVKKAVSQWEGIADKYGISRHEKELKRKAFNFGSI